MKELAQIAAVLIVIGVIVTAGTQGALDFLGTGWDATVDFVQDLLS